MLSVCQNNMIWNTTNKSNHVIFPGLGATYSPVYDDGSNKINAVFFLENNS